jgi:DNA-binding transcriptional MerR regulator
VLRQIDMPLEEIAHLLEEDDPAIIAARLKAHRDRLAARLADQERMLRFLEKLIEREAGVMPYQVTVKEVADQPVLASRKHTTLRTIGDDLQTGFGQLVGAMDSSGATMSGAPCPPREIYLNHPTSVAPEDIRTEIQWPID